MSQIPLEQEEGAMGRPLPAGAILLSEEDLQQAAQQLDPAQSLEERWGRFLRHLSLQALKRWLGERKSSVVVGPEINPEDPDRLLALNGLATQLLCASPLADVVEVPINHWRTTATAPQLLLLSQVDEDAGVVHFPGVLDAKEFIAEVMRLKASNKDAVGLPLERFQGGLERMLRWVSLLEKEALPRVGLSPSPGPASDLLNELQEWVRALLDGPTLIPIPVVRGTRGGLPIPVRTRGLPIPVSGTRGLPPKVVVLITPQVNVVVDGTATAHLHCSTPTIWTDTPLAEIRLEGEKSVLLWWKVVTTKEERLQGLRGPIPWPLEAPLQPHQKITLKLRPYRAPGADYASIELIAPDATQMRLGEQVIANAIKESALATNLKNLIPAEHRALAGEVAARLWPLFREKKAEGLNNGSEC